MQLMKEPLLLGAHMPINDGFASALEKGELLGCTAIQIFTKSNRQWKARTLTEHEKELFTQKWQTSSIQSVIVHASYLINIASPDQDLAEKSLAALIIEIKRCEFLGIPFLVLHPGSAKTDPHTSSRAINDSIFKQVASYLTKALEETFTCTILLETMAGQGSTVGATFHELAGIVSHMSHKKRIGFCLDTCHLFAAGYDFTTRHTYDALLHEWDQVLGLDMLHTIHINDSKTARGSRVDRHASIGEGTIGIDSFRFFMNDARLRHIPKILETPHKNFADFEKDLTALKKLVSTRP